MNYRRLGKHGIRVSEISLGAWLTYGGSVESDTAERIVHAAVDHGINYIDLADVYSKGEAEKVVGRAIKDMTRSNLVISSKLFWPMSDNVNDRGLGRKHIMESVEKSLRRLGTDYLDLYFCHRFDPETEVEETVRAMSDLVTQGKILYWGTSVWESEQIERAVGEARACSGYLPAVEQPRYHMLDRHIEPAIMPVCAHNGMGIVVWSPLAQGILTGKYNDGVPRGTRASETKWLEGLLTEESVAKARKLSEIAAELDLTLGQLALAWILRRPEISSAIVGATRAEQLEENVKASGVVLEKTVLDRIEEIIGEAPVTRFRFR